MRHAEAVEPAHWNGPDASRPLSPVGKANLTAAMAGIRRSQVTADAILTSPFARAKETAAVLAAELKVPNVIECPELAAGARLPALQALLREHASLGAVWIVAHMPEVAAFAAAMAGAPSVASRGFEPGEAACADCEVGPSGPAGGSILWRRRLDEW